MKNYKTNQKFSSIEEATKILGSSIRSWTTNEKNKEVIIVELFPTDAAELKEQQEWENQWSENPNDVELMKIKNSDMAESEGNEEMEEFYKLIGE